jgi:transketolase C-terminal domain/subunit
VDPSAMAGAELVRTGGDVLLIGYSLMTQRALAAADALDREGVSASVLNLRVLAPSPIQDVLEAPGSIGRSCSSTNRVRPTVRRAC